VGGPEGSWSPGARGPRPPPESNRIDLVIGGPISCSDVQELWDRVRPLLDGDDADVVCDVAALVGPDAGTVDALARLQLLALRFGCHIRLDHACGRLQELLVLMGLGDVLPCSAGLPIQPGRQAEEGEQPGGIEEEGDAVDPVG
jgi:ABC-type transporter Mla MlaB component